MHRFFVAPTSIHENTVILQGDIAHQIRNVLRMAPGDHICVLDNSGMEYEIELSTIERSEVFGQVIEKRANSSELPIHVTLYQGMPKKDKFEWILQKGTELGISHFVPIITERTIAIPKSDRIDKKLDRWQRIVSEAAEQSGRAVLPDLSEPTAFSELNTLIQNHDLCVILWEETHQETRLKTILSENSGIKNIAIIVGPEGGLTPTEVELAQDYGAKTASLGALILRTETAAIYAAAVIHYVYG